MENSLTVDTGHLVAFESTLQYTITKAGTSWLQSWLAGEGFVMNFTGRGRVLTQSHNPKEFGSALGAFFLLESRSEDHEISDHLRSDLQCRGSQPRCRRAIRRRIGRHGMDDGQHQDRNVHARRFHGRA